MKYIKRVTLENFQSHKYSVIDFKEQLNVIVGPSDSGKSAIIRGIKWALYNEPSGDYFIKEGEKDCSVTIEFNDNVKLKRYRSRYKNSYILTNRNGEEIRFEGFGTTIPIEIIETIGIKKIHLDSDESNAINLGEQLEGAFLLGEKSGIRASAIGRLVGVNIIDDALREVLRDTRNLNIQKKNIDENIESLENEIKQFDYLDDVKTKLKEIENIKSRIIAINNTLDKIKLAYENLKHINQESIYLKDVVKRLGKIDKVNETIAIIDSKNFKYIQLFRYYNSLKTIKNNINDSEFILSRLNNLDKVQYTSKKLEDYCILKQTLENYKIRYIKINTEHNELSTTIAKLAKLPEVGLKLDNIDKNYKYHTKLSELSSRHNNIIKSIEIGEKYLNQLSGIYKSDENANIIIEKIEILYKFQKHYNNLLINSKELEGERNNIITIRKNIENQLSRYEELLKKLEICPFCLSNINDDKINHIVNHYIGG